MPSDAPCLEQRGVTESFSLVEKSRELYEEPVDELMREHGMTRSSAISIVNHYVDINRPAGHVIFVWSEKEEVEE